MKTFFSPSAAGFYVDDIHQQRPADCIEIDIEQYLELLNGQEAGRVIVPGDDGRPVLAPPAKPDNRKRQASGK